MQSADISSSTKDFFAREAKSKHLPIESWANKASKRPHTTILNSPASDNWCLALAGVEKHVRKRRE